MDWKSWVINKCTVLGPRSYFVVSFWLDLSEECTSFSLTYKTLDTECFTSQRTAGAFTRAIEDAGYLASLLAVTVHGGNGSRIQSWRPLESPGKAWDIINYIRCGGQPWVVPLERRELWQGLIYEQGVGSSGNLCTYLCGEWILYRMEITRSKRTVALRYYNLSISIKHLSLLPLG